MKPSDLVTIEIASVEIGLFLISRLEIDLRHINYGLDKVSKNYKKNARSNFNEYEVAKIFSELDGFFLSANGIQDNFLYYAVELEFFKIDYVLVFCIDYKNPSTAGIITLYKSKKRT